MASELLVVETQEVENRCVKVIHVNRFSRDVHRADIRLGLHFPDMGSGGLQCQPRSTATASAHLHPATYSFCPNTHIV